MRFQKSLGVLSLLLSCVMQANSAPKCDNSDAVLRKCMEELTALANNTDLAFAQTEHELQVTCGYLQEAVECVNNFTSHCLDDTSRELYKTMTRGAQQLLQDLCTQGSEFRTKYLVHAGCYKSLSSEYMNCAKSYLSNQEAARDETVPWRYRVKKACCLFDGYKECTRMAVLQNCSQEAAELGVQIVTMTGGPLIQSQCSRLKHDGPDCAPYTALSTAPSARLDALLALAIVLLLLMAYGEAVNR